jgi:hypothetical protein
MTIRANLSSCSPSSMARFDFDAQPGANVAANCFAMAACAAMARWYCYKGL